MYYLQYNESISTKMHEHYTFINIKHACTVVTARLFIPIEFIIYHDRKKISFYHVYDNDKNILDELFKCVYEISEILGIENYDVDEITNGNIYYIEYIKRKYGVNNENN